MKFMSEAFHFENLDPINKRFFFEGEGGGG